MHDVIYQRLPTPKHHANLRALSLLMKPEAVSMVLIRRVFFTRTGIHPRAKPEDMLRSKTL
jgi:hypothetical protein